MEVDSIAILDCGGQYTKVIDRRIREFSIRSEIFPIDTESGKLRKFHGLVLSGGPASVWAEERPSYDPGIFELGLPVLGICYGMQLINQHFGGVVEPGLKEEYGTAEIVVDSACPLFEGLETNQTVLMSHGDSVSELGDGFVRAADSGEITAAIYHPEDKIFGVQFHPEVDLTENGRRMLENFLRNVCGLGGNFLLEDRIATAIERINKTVVNSRVLVLVSGGVDSAVSAALLLKALKPDQIYALHVDHGLMRKNESERICANLKRMGLRNLIHIHAEKTFFEETVQDGECVLGPLIKVVDPEEKRKIIGSLFIKVVEDVAREQGLDFQAMYLAQGTLRPDLIESGNPDISDYAHKIKTHHNDVQLIREARAEGRVIETNWDWHKDEVRRVARTLGIEEEIAGRQPFPGPGLAIRTLCTDGKDRSTGEERERFSRVLAEHPVDGELIPLRTVGVQGDHRSYRYFAVLVDGGGALNWTERTALGTALPGNLDFLNRVVFLMNEHRWTGRPSIYPNTISRQRMDLLRELDAVVRKSLEGPAVSQVFPVLLPLGIQGKLSVAIRAIVTNDYMTGRSALIGKDIPESVMKELVEEIEGRFSEIDLILYDVTGKPPATVEWE